MTDWDRYREIVVFRDSGHPAEALAEFKSLRESAVEAVDKSSILLAEAACHRDLGHLDEAAEAASEAIRLLPEKSETRPFAEFCLACIHESQSKFDLAAQEFRTILRKHIDALANSECVQLRRDVQIRLIANLIMLGHALEPLSIADALKKEDISPQERVELVYREATAHGILGRSDQAAELYEEAILGPLDRSLIPRAHFHIGKILYDRGEFSRALDEFRLAESQAGPESSDKDHFTRWVKHTLRRTKS